jgi:glyoxylase-like metal-dependent hydrolase (beta-lactamase superfamily II)
MLYRAILDVPRKLAAIVTCVALAWGASLAHAQSTKGASTQGTIRVARFGNVKIHSYVSPADGWKVTSQIVEGPKQHVIFDGQLLLPYATEVAAHAAGLGKPVERIVLSHGHPDHWSGLQVLTEKFPSAKVYALPGIADALNAQGQYILTALRPGFGDKIADKVTIPTGVIQEGRQTIDGVVYDFKRYLDAESDLQLVALLPEQKVLMAFDLVFPAKDHLFTIGAHFDHWISVLDELKAMRGYDTVLVGHDGPVDAAAFDATKAYLKKAKEAYAASSDAKSYAQALKTAYPDRQQSGWIDFSSQLLYSKPKS